MPDARDIDDVEVLRTGWIYEEKVDGWRILAVKDGALKEREKIRRAGWWN